MARSDDIARCGRILCLALVFDPPIAAQEAGAERSTRRVQAARTGGEITLDGALDEASWGVVSIARGFIQNERLDAVPHR
jgi:hypothetical protein